MKPRRDEVRAIFRHAIKRGEIPVDTKAEAAFDILYGAIYHRLLYSHAALNGRFVRDVIDIAVDGVGRHPASDTCVSRATTTIRGRG